MVEARVQRARQRLAARDEGPASPAPVGVILLLLLLDLVLVDERLDDVLHVANLDQHVLGLQVRVDDAALAVQVVQAQQHLLRDLLDQRHRDAAVVPALDEAQQVLPEHLKHHAHVRAVGALVLERVEQADDVLAPRVLRVGGHDLVEQLDLVDGRLRVVRR